MQAQNYKKVHSVTERLNRLRLHKGWTWTELAQKLDISLSLLMQIKANKRALSESVNYTLAQLELQSGVQLDPDDLAAQLHEVAHPYTLPHRLAQEEIPRENDATGWKKRSLMFEKRYKDLRNALRSILVLAEEEPPAPPSTPSSMYSPAELEARRILEEAARMASPAHSPRPSPPATRSGPSKSPRPHGGKPDPTEPPSSKQNH